MFVSLTCCLWHNCVNINECCPDYVCCEYLLNDKRHYCSYCSCYGCDIFEKEIVYTSLCLPCCPICWCIHCRCEFNCISISGWRFRFKHITSGYLTSATILSFRSHNVYYRGKASWRLRLRSIKSGGLRRNVGYCLLLDSTPYLLID